VGDHVIEVINPRAVRLGARVRWGETSTP